MSREQKRRRKIKQIKKRMIEKGQTWCAWCGESYSPDNAIYELHAHHKISRGQGGPDREDNLELICFACHRRHHDGR